MHLDSLHERPEKRAYGPSLVLGGAFSCVLGVVAIDAWIAWWLALALLTLGAMGAGLRVGRGFLALAVSAFNLWLIAHALLLSHVYRPEALFIACLFQLSFMLGVTATARELERAAWVMTMIVCVLALWALVQHWLGWWAIGRMGGGARAVLASPNTLATLINLCLLALIARCLSGRASRWEWGAVMLLLMALLSTQSRGGLLALVAGVSALVLLFRRAEVKLHRGSCLGLGLGALMCLGIELGPGGTHVEAESTSNRIVDAITHADTAGRWDLYRVALLRIAQNPWWGDGYLSFARLYERSGEDVFAGNHTEYVHSDYLQIWLEMGIIGLAGLVAIGIAAWSSLWRRVRGASPEETILLCALGGAIASVFAHAALDFPFYSRAVVILLGAMLGTVGGLDASARTTLDAGRGLDALAHRLHVRKRFLELLLALLFLGWMAAPALAQAAAARGHAALKRLEVGRAIGWYELALDLAPYDAYYYWTLGVIWERQGIVREDHAAAAIADRLYARGIAVDPGYDRTWIHRLRLHREHPQLLAGAASVETLLAWAESLRALAPNRASGVIEHIETLAYAGDMAGTQAALKAAAVRFPRAPWLRRLERELGDAQGSSR